MRVLINDIITRLEYVYYVSVCVRRGEGGGGAGGVVSVWVAIVKKSVYIINEYVVRLVMENITLYIVNSMLI